MKYMLVMYGCCIIICTYKTYRTRTCKSHEHVTGGICTFSQRVKVLRLRKWLYMCDVNVIPKPQIFLTEVIS